MNYFRVVAAQKYDNPRNIFRLRPFREIGFGHVFSIRFRIDDAGKNRIHADSGAVKLAREPAELAFAGFDVVINGDGNNDENPHWENAHSGDRLCDQTRQNRPSTAEDQKQK